MLIISQALGVFKLIIHKQLRNEWSEIYTVIIFHNQLYKYSDSTKNVW